MVVPGSKIGVTDRPVDGNPFVKVSFEIQVTPAIHLPAPHNGATPYLTSSNPSERLTWFCCVRVLFVVHEELRRPFIARITQALNRLVVFYTTPVAHSTKPHLPRWNMFDIVLFR